MKKGIYILSIVFLVIDQIIKFFVVNNIANEVVVIDNFFSINYVCNSGAAFSLFSGQIIFLIVCNLVILGILYKYMNSFIVNKRNMLAFGLLIGGLLGNLVDRIRIFCVIDYLDFNILGYDAPIFNFADASIFIGVMLMIYAIFRNEDSNGNSNRN